MHQDKQGMHQHIRCTSRCMPSSNKETARGQTCMNFTHAPPPRSTTIRNLHRHQPDIPERRNNDTCCMTSHATSADYRRASTRSNIINTHRHHSRHKRCLQATIIADTPFASSPRSTSTWSSPTSSSTHRRRYTIHMMDIYISTTLSDSTTARHDDGMTASTTPMTTLTSSDG
jgi:hypothetical protein